VTERLLTAAALIDDLGGADPGFVLGVSTIGGNNLEVDIDAGHASTSRAVAQEADDFDDLAYLGKLLAAVFVELVDRIRVLQGEPHGVVGPRRGHNWTMAGRR
jgi:hypothetical protein